MTVIDRLVYPGSIPNDAGAGPARLDVFVKVKYGPDALNPGKPGPVLSLTGVIGAKRNGDAWGSCGQILQVFARSDPSDNDARYSRLVPPSDFVFAPGWDSETWLRLLDVWKRWHMNGMRAECEHQRALGWTYDTHRDPDPAAPGAPHVGLPCPECDYRIGSAWLYEPVPDDVVAFLDGLPAATKPCPWGRL